MKQLLIYLCIVFLLPISQTVSVFAENNIRNNSEKISVEFKFTDQGLKKVKSISDHDLQRDSSAKTGNILQLVEDLLNGIEIGLALFSIFITLFLYSVGAWFVNSKTNLKKEIVEGKEKFDIQYKKIKKLMVNAEGQFSSQRDEIGLLTSKADEKLDSQYKKIKKLTAKAEEQFCSQTDEIELLTSKADEKHEETLKETNARFKKLDEIDLLTKTKISAIQKTLILCLENAPNRDIAFATYSKLLAAYEVLLNNSHEKITDEMQEEMEIKATLIQGNRKYVPEETVRFMIENMNLPYEVRGILWGNP